MKLELGNKKSRLVKDFKFKPGEVYFKVLNGELSNSYVINIRFIKFLDEDNKISENVFNYFSNSHFKDDDIDIFDRPKDALNDWRLRQTYEQSSDKITNYIELLTNNLEKKKARSSYAFKFDINDTFFAIDYGEVVCHNVGRIELDIDYNNKDNSIDICVNYKKCKYSKAYREEDVFATKEEAINEWIKRQRKTTPKP